MTVVTLMQGRNPRERRAFASALGGIGWALLVFLALPQPAQSQPVPCPTGNNGEGFCCRSCDIPATGPVEGLDWSMSAAGAPPGTTIGGPFDVGPNLGTVIYTDAPAVGIRQAEADPRWFALPSAVSHHLRSDLTLWVSDELEFYTTGGEFVSFNPKGPPCGDDTMGVLPMTPPIDFASVFMHGLPNDKDRISVLVDAGSVYRVTGGLVDSFARPGGAFVGVAPNPGDPLLLDVIFAGGTVSFTLLVNPVCTSPSIRLYSAFLYSPGTALVPIAGMPPHGQHPAQPAETLARRGPERAGSSHPPERLLRWISAALAPLDWLSARPAWAIEPQVRVNIGGGGPPFPIEPVPALPVESLVVLAVLLLASSAFVRQRRRRARGD